jgi:hypothetical protein
MGVLGAVSALAVPGALWIVVAAAWTASDLIGRGASSSPWMERRSV